MNDDLNRLNDRILAHIEDRRLEPDPDPKVYCSFCEEEIPSDGYYYEVGCYIYCPDCMETRKHYVDY